MDEKQVAKEREKDRALERLRFLRYNLNYVLSLVRKNHIQEALKLLEQSENQLREIQAKILSLLDQ
jgi:hypothetical protein